MRADALLVRTGRIGYEDSWQVQRELAERRRAGALPDVVWLLEHPPVYTYGRHASRADLHLADDELARLGASCHRIDRGGQMTWHGPGQTTGYLICDLRPRGSVRRFVEALVHAMNDAAALPDAAADLARPGVYLDGRKLGSVGIRVESGITTHGIALNRDPDLAWFARMTACGAPDVAASSIAAEGGDPERAAVEGRLAAALAERLGRRLIPVRAGAVHAGMLGEPPA